MRKLRKLMIVVEDTGEHGGKGFNVYLDGDIDRLQAGIAVDDRSPAEHWGLELFRVCGEIITQTGTGREIKKEDAH